MKRLTETAKWKDHWFRTLPPAYKLFWQYLCDECDMAGFIEPDFELASFVIGADIDRDQAQHLLTGHIEVFPDGKWWIPKFIRFQYGELSMANSCHRGVCKVLVLRGYEGPMKGLPRGYQAPKDKDKGTEKDKDQNKSPNIQAILNEKELYRVEEDMRRVRSSYDPHQDMSAEDRAALKVLKARQAELKAALGFKA